MVWTVKLTHECNRTLARMLPPVPMRNQENATESGTIPTMNSQNPTVRNPTTSC